MTDYSQDWEELSEKEILIGILTELQQIRLAMATQPEERPTYQCTRCSWEGPPEDREQHAKAKHKCPPELVEQIFERKN